MNRLYRSTENKMLAGVCGGMAEYFQIDVSLIRLVWILMFLAGGSGLLLYIIAWIIIPEKEEEYEQKIPQDNKTNTLFGILLIAIGVVLLFDRYIPWRSLTRLWPAGLIILGVIMIVGWKGDRS